MRYWNKKLKCWWDFPYIIQQDGKIYAGYWRDGKAVGIDITEYIEVRP